MKTTGTETKDGGLAQRLERLLGSLTAVVSARVVLDQETGAQVHILATAEIPVSEVSRAVTSVLTWGLGFEVPADQITVAQSRLSREELNALLGSDRVGPAPTPVAPKESASPPNFAAPPQEGALPNSRASTRDTGLLEFSLQKASAERGTGPEPHIHRLELQDLQLNRKPQGGFGILVRLTGNDRSIGAQRDAAGTEEDSLEVPACTALGVIQEFLRSTDNGEMGVMLRFLAARRLRSAEHDVVVVLVEADVDGRRIPLTGAASAYQGVERASILATLQATNALVADTMGAESSNGARAR